MVQAHSSLYILCVHRTHTHIGGDLVRFADIAPLVRQHTIAHTLRQTDSRCCRGCRVGKHKHGPLNELLRYGVAPATTLRNILYRSLRNQFHTRSSACGSLVFE